MTVRHRVVYWLVLAVGGSILAIARAWAQEPCTQPADLPTATVDLPFEVTYGGTFPRTSQGADVTAYLDEERIAHLLTIEYYGEYGKSLAVFRFESRNDYAVGWEEYSYAHSIYDGGDLDVTLTEEVCFQVRDGRLSLLPTDAVKELAPAVLADLDLVLAEYLPCELRFPSPPQPATEPPPEGIAKP